MRTLVRALVAAAAPIPARIGLTLTDDPHITALNEQHMGHEGPTDVLSFPLLEPGAFPAHGGQDPRVRTRRARRSCCHRACAPTWATSWSRSSGPSSRRSRAEAATPATSAGRPPTSSGLLVTHGALHVCGWDHALPAEEAAMRALERRLLSGVDRPDRRRAVDAARPCRRRPDRSGSRSTNRAPPPGASSTVSSPVMAPGQLARDGQTQAGAGRGPSLARQTGERLEDAVPVRDRHARALVTHRQRRRAAARPPVRG